MSGLNVEATRLDECNGDQAKLTSVLTDAMTAGAEPLSATSNPHQIEAIDQVKDDAAFQKQVSGALKTPQQKTLDKAEQRKIKKVAKELAQVQSRKQLLEGKLQHASRDDLLNLMKDAEDGKVEVLGQVYDVDEALQTLGVKSAAERDALKTYRNERTEIDNIISLMKEDGVDEDAERINKAILESFRASVSRRTVDDLTRLKNAMDTEYAEGIESYKSEINQFEEMMGLQTGELDFAIKMAMFSDSGQPADEGEQAMITKFKEWLHESTPTGDRDELQVRINAFNAILGQYHDQMGAVLDSRRGRILPYAIATFNKIQEKSLPLWMTEAGELNAEKNVHGVQKSTIATKEGVELTQKTKGLVQLGDPRISKAVENDKLSFSKNSFEKDQTVAYLNSNSKVADPSLINETIERYDYLLTQEQSPILSNFTHLLDYSDGSDMMPFEQFREKANDGQLLKKYMTQANKMMTLCDELDRMRAVITDMGSHIRSQGEELNDEITRTMHARQEVIERRAAGASDALGKVAASLHAQLPDDPTQEEKIAFMQKALAMSGYESMDVYN